MRILALEPYYGGSHQSFLDGWSARSRHTWSVLGLPAYKWKWRMRHGAITLADRVSRLVADGERWDLVFCSDMLNLAEFKGLVAPPIRDLPSVAYFHENQLTYPVRHEDERDYHYVLTNLTTALAATQVWFNSAYHRDSFLEALPAFFKRMPDHQPTHAVEVIRGKSDIQPPGIDAPPTRGPRSTEPCRILWAARWEHDKNPDTFFAALKILKRRGVAFRLSVIGEQFRDSPEVFTWARQFFSDHIDRWGFQSSRQEYQAALAEADVVVSTADHEFFGISVLEAVAAGARAVLPRRLAYPELFDPEDHAGPAVFYDGTEHELADRLQELAPHVGPDDAFGHRSTRPPQAVERFLWNNRVRVLDDSIEQCA